MPATKLISKLIIYYLVIIAGVWLVLTAWPDIRHYLPIGGAEHLITDASKSSSLKAAAAEAQVRTLGQSLGWMTVAILGALVTAIPVSWVYMATRTSEEYDQSLISSILILPVVVTSIVVGVLAAWRWRSRLAASPGRCGSRTASKARATRSTSCCRSGSACRRGSVRSSWRSS